MDTFPPPAPPPLQPHSTNIPIIDTNFTTPTIVNPIPIGAQIEAQISINHSAANAIPNPVPVPAAGPAPGSHHPPYAEMISSAIEALKERDGSSKRAIAKYIEQSYSGLPPTHSALLSHHLKRLKNNGLLVMVKKSYKLQNADSATAALQAPILPILPTSGSPRGRGRPPKPKPDAILQSPLQPNVQHSVQHILQHPVQPPLQPAGQFTGQSFPPPGVQFNGQITSQPTVHFNGQTVAQPNVQPNSQPVLVALGLVDEPNPALGKKRPGRPKKVMAVGVAQGGPGFVKRGRGRPPGSKGKLMGSRLSKKSPGRPRKLKSVLGALGPKRGPGRPSKAEPQTMIIPYATNVPVVTAADQNSIPNVFSVPPRARGRPKKISGSAAAVGILSGKRRGRPPKGAVVNKVRSYTGRPVGRPKKTAPASTGASDALITANGDLKRKLDYFQSKVKQAVGMLKPQLTHESPVTAIAAVQELEELAVMDLSTPLREEVQHPTEQN